MLLWSYIFFVFCGAIFIWPQAPGSPAVYAQGFTVTSLPTQKQLPVANIHAILQDQEGYMWYATYGGGLCRDNGYQIDVFRSDRNHPRLIGNSNDITCIAEWSNQSAAGASSSAAYDRIVFGTRDGAYVLDKGDYSIWSLDPELKGKKMEAAYVARTGEVWLSANPYVYHYDPRFKRRGKYRSLWKGKEKTVTSFYEDARGKIWMTQWDGGIVSYDKRRRQLEPQPWTDGVTPSRMVEDPVQGCFWVATWGREIMRYLPAERKIEPQASKSSVLALQVMDMCFDSSRRLWLSTMEGLRCYDIIPNGATGAGSQLRSVDIGSMVPKGIHIIDGLALDRKGNLWVSGFSPLTFILSPKRDGIVRHSADELENNNHSLVWNIAREGSKMWIGRDRLGVCVYNAATSRLNVAYRQERDGLYTQTDMSWFCKRRDKPGVWCYYQQDLYWLRVERGRFVRQHILHTGNLIKHLYDDGHGNLYISMAGGIDVYSYGPQASSYRPQAPHAATGRVTQKIRCKGSVGDVVRTPAGTLYFISSREGLMCLGADGPPRVLSTLGDFTALALDASGCLWAADKQGNLVYCRQNWHRVVVDERGSNRNGDAIKDLAVDAAGHLWMVSDQYVKEYNPRSGAYRTLYCQDKNISMDNFCSVIPDGKGVTLCGTRAILSVASSPLIDSKLSDARPLITAVTIGGRVSDGPQVPSDGPQASHIVGMSEDEIEVRPSDTNLTIQLSTLNHLNTERVAYAYRLKGIDDNWHTLPAGVNKASFFKLAKGDYVLEVKATDEFGRWSENVTALKIHRIAAWYESTWAYCAYLLLVMAVALGAFGMYMKVQKRKQQHKMMEQLTELKFRFFTNVSHELRTPLTLILTPLQAIMKRIDSWSAETPLSPGRDAPADERMAKIKSQVKVASDNAQRLLELVNRLLDFRKIEMGQAKLELTTGDVFDFIRNVCETFRPMSQEKGIGLGVAIPNKNLFMSFDASKLRHILTNLLSNAFKFTPEGGKIAVSVRVISLDSGDSGGQQAPAAYREALVISVADNGCGIAAHDLPHIFERYYQATHSLMSKRLKGNGVHPLSANPPTGTGIGLNMVQEFVQLHQGTIEVRSKAGEGTVFTVTLPTGLKPRQPQAADTKPEAKGSLPEPPGVPLTRPSLLVVDDNDEFRQFLAGELSEEYAVAQAVNGDEALRKVESHDIGLVVSDVMMPGMDGMELCRRIKGNVGTSHVMVILLTARAAGDSRIEGLRSGADDYLSKPFSMEMLQLRIARLLELRSNRVRKFEKFATSRARQDEVRVEDVAHGEIDQKFLRQALAAVERNLGNEAYSVEMFCSDLCMSRSTCYRKMVSLTGQKPSEFVRTIRLKHAARLITEGKRTISEVATHCGFSSVSYFCRCFKAQYGVQPGSY